MSALSSVPTVARMLPSDAHEAEHDGCFMLKGSFAYTVFMHNLHFDSKDQNDRKRLHKKGDSYSLCM